MTHHIRLRRALALLLALCTLAALALPALAAEDAPAAETADAADAPAPAGPFDALTWWVIPLALAIALAGSGALRLVLRSPDRWTKHMQKKYDRFTAKKPEERK